MKKIKQHVLMVSKRFPHYHSRKGEFTWFEEKIFLSQTTPPGTLVPVKDLFGNGATMDFYPKLHTCRPNYERWKKKIDEVSDGKAVLVLKYWSGRPYHSSPVEIMRLTNVGVQKIHLHNSGIRIFHPTDYGRAPQSYLFSELSEFWINDGFTSFNDFYHWFCPPYKRPHIGRVLDKTVALIHFTNFRY